MTTRLGIVLGTALLLAPALAHPRKPAYQRRPAVRAPGLPTRALARFQTQINRQFRKVATDARTQVDTMGWIYKRSTRHDYPKLAGVRDNLTLLRGFKGSSRREAVRSFNRVLRTTCGDASSCGVRVPASLTRYLDRADLALPVDPNTGQNRRGE